MTRKRQDTINGLPAVERLHDKRDEKYTRCRNYAVYFLDESEVRACVIDPEDFQKKLPKMLSDMAAGIFLNEDIRPKVFPDEIQTSDQAISFAINGAKESRGKARNLYDFLIMSLRSQIDNTKNLDELRKHIAERLKSYLDPTIKKWKDILTKDKLTSEEEKIKFKLVDNGHNFVQLILEFFDDLTKTELMNIFGFFLRRIGIKQIKPEVIKVLNLLLITTFKKECNELLKIIHERRSEGMHINRQRSGILLSAKAIQEPTTEEEPLPKVQAASVQPAGQALDEFSKAEADPFQPDVSDADKLNAKAQKQATGTLLQVEEPQPEGPVEEEEDQEEAGFILEINPDPQPATQEDTGRINRKKIEQEEEGPSKATAWALRGMLGAAAITVLVGGGILYSRGSSPQTQPKKGKDPIASKASTLETKNPPSKIIKIPPHQVIQADAAVPPPNQIKQADAAVAPTPPPKPPGPKRIITPTPAPTPPTKPILKKSNPNLTKIAQTTVNDLPANYADKYKSLYLGQKINLNGDSMSGYIESAIREIASRSQWRKFKRYLNGKMKPGWSMYMASINDPWFEQTYKKKYRRWYKKGKRDLKRYEKLLKRKADGKKLSRRQERHLKRYEEQMRVGRLTMLSLGAMNLGKDANNLSTGNFSNEKGEVASIVTEMAEAAGLEIPEIITAEIETAKPKEPEVQLADITPEQDPPQDDVPQDDEPQVDDDNHDPVQAGQDLLKRVQKIEAEKAVQAKVVSKVMNKAADGVLAKIKQRKEEKAQVMEDAVDRVLDRLEISKKFRDMAKAREAEPKTDNDYYASIEVEKPPAKEEEIDPFDVEVAAAEAVSGTDEDYYASIKYIKEEPDYTAEITREDHIQNQLAEVEPVNTKPKGVLSRMGRWFGRKAA